MAAGVLGGTYRCPCLALAEWVYTTTELVDEDNRAITNESNCQAELALVSA